MAKAQGKNRYQLFEPRMHEDVLERMSLKADLQRAIEHNEFELFYQPVVVLSTGELSGFEALARWRHPEKGLVAPMDFIPLAEESGLIVRLGKWIIEEACRQAVRLQAQFPKDPPLTMSVNLSARQIQNATLIDEVRDALARSGLAPTSLVL